MWWAPTGKRYTLAKQQSHMTQEKKKKRRLLIVNTDLNYLKIFVEYSFWV